MRTYILILILLATQQLAAEPFNISDFGAKPDGITNNTAAIQRALDSCASVGGGEVLVPKGVFVSGTIFLRDNVTLYLDKMAVLQGIPDERAYPGRHFAEKGFIRIDSATNVSIIGEGTIDGNGGHEVFQKGNNGTPRPYLIHVRDSKDVNIQDVTLKNSAFWTLRLLGNERVKIKGLSIYGHANWNNDGIDIDSKDVIISDCYIDVDDDAICLKSDRQNQIVENVVVTNCVLASNCNHIKFGTASHGGFRNITISNCVLKPASVSHLRGWHKLIDGVDDTLSATSGIALEAIDGAFIDQVAIQNITMRGVQTPIFMRLGSTRNVRGSLSSMSNVLISNIVAYSNSKIPSSITAIPGLAIKNIMLKDIHIINTVAEFDSAIMSKQIPEVPRDYPENRMMGHSLPATGFYVRRARNILFDNIRVTPSSGDIRPVFFIDQGQNVEIRNIYSEVTDPSNFIRHVSSKNITN